jgi:hypothetical protein
MRKLKYLLIMTLIFFGIFASSCEKDEMKNDTAITDFSYFESFDTIQKVISQKGWIAINNSRPLGVSTWTQGVYTIDFFGNFAGFPAHSSVASATEYAYCDFTSGDDIATLSCWLISPVLNIQNGDVISFWTRASDPPVTYPDRLQVYANLKNDGINVGTDAESIGDFDQLIFDINPNLTTTDYPTSWEKFEWTVNGLNASGRTPARIGFRYYVTDAGPNGANSNFIGIDDFELKTN